jgi:hypothetical protein
MQTLVVVQVKVARQIRPRLVNRAIIFQINLVIFDSTPKTLHKNVIKHSACAIHTDRNTGIFQNANEAIAGELRVLIRIEDLRPCDQKSLSQGFYAKVGIQRGRQRPDEHIAANRRMTAKSESLTPRGS